MILVISLNGYTQYKVQSYQQQLSSNVDQLFYTAQSFYRMMCRESLDVSGGQLSPGVLDVRQAPVATTFYPVSITGTDMQMTTTTYTDQTTGEISVNNSPT